MQIILNHQQIEQKIIRIGHQLLENCFEEERIFIGGIVGNGSAIAQKLAQIIRMNSSIEVICFDIHVNKDEPWSEPIQLSIDEKELKKGFIILVDDVVNSGKTMQYALMKFLEQATKAIKTVALVDRQHRRYPIKTDFVGLGLSTTLKNHVEVDLNESDSKAYLH
ncbi:MAG: phosphoribosyltransferase family protein [Flavobacteriales bacterium]